MSEINQAEIKQAEIKQAAFKLPETKLKDVSRILVIRYRFIGDTILTGPFLKNLRLAYPHAIIDVLVGPQSGEVLFNCPYINELISFDTTRFHKYDQGKGKPRSFWSYVWELKKRRYDTVFVLKRSLSSALLAFLIGAKNRVGYATKGRGFLLTHKATWRQDIHEVESTFEVLKAAAIDCPRQEVEAWISEEESSQVKAIAPGLGQDNLKVLIHAAAAHPDKLYPLEHWAAVIKVLHNETGAEFYFSGSEQDQALYAELEKLAGLECHNLAGKLSLRQSMALYKEMDLAICTDSGPSHLAAASGTRTIALFGPTDPMRWAPWGDKNLAIYDTNLACRPCNYNKTCQNRECLTELAPELVIEKAKEFLTLRK